MYFPFMIFGPHYKPTKLINIMQILYVVAVISLLSFCLYAYSKMTGRKI